MMWTYVALIVFFLAWLIMTSSRNAQKPEFRGTMAVVQTVRLRRLSAGDALLGTAIERNTQVPGFEGFLLTTAALAGIAVAFLALATASSTFSSAASPSASREARSSSKPAAAARYAARPVGPLPGGGGSGLWRARPAWAPHQVRDEAGLQEPGLHRADGAPASFIRSPALVRGMTLFGTRHSG
jgi:hypothetical protein